MSRVGIDSVVRGRSGLQLRGVDTVSYWLDGEGWAAVRRGGGVDIDDLSQCGEGRELEWAAFVDGD